jgi:mono/diheme cytochrome c family protein
MKRGIIIASVVLVGLFLLVSFKSEESVVLVSKIDVEAETVVSGSVSGRDLFLQNCSACHLADLSGNPPMFPNLQEVSTRLSKADIALVLINGRNAMPSFKHLSIEERNAIIGYLYGENTVASVENSASEAEIGKRIFVANCASCHKTVDGDDVPAGQRGCGMTPPVLGGVSQRIDFNSFERILNFGPWYMPSFEHLSQEEKNNVYEYLGTIEAPLDMSRYRSRSRRSYCRR